MVQYYKYPRAVHWRHDLVTLGQDEHGIWLGAPAGTIVQRGHEDPIPWPDPFVQLVVDGRWWTMIYNGRRPKTRYYVDIVTAPEWVAEDRVEFIDLDLDVVKYQNGRVAVLDEDEFEEHSQSYPADLVERAATVTGQVRAALETGSSPFDGVAERWLTRVS